MRPAIALTALSVLLIGAAPAKPVKVNPASKIQAGTYHADPDHTQVRFGVSHMGISPYFGIIAGATGTLSLDPANVAAAKVDIEIPVANLMTTSAKLNDELKSSDWLDATKFPTMSFHSTKVTLVAADTAAVTGNLTIHGVTKPVTMRVKYFGSGDNPMTKKPNVGFTAGLAINRSEFGVKQYVPMISDVVGLTINAAFEKAD